MARRLFTPATTRDKHSPVFARPASPRARRVFLCLDCCARATRHETLRTPQNEADFRSIKGLIHGAARLRALLKGLVGQLNRKRRGILVVGSCVVITQGVGRRGWREAERSVRAPPLRGAL